MHVDSCLGLHGGEGWKTIPVEGKGGGIDREKDLEGRERYRDRPRVEVRRKAYMSPCTRFVASRKNMGTIAHLPVTPTP